MPPQGESIGLAIEDAVLLSQVLRKYRGELIEESLKLYERTRRPRINDAVKAANFGFETIKARTWFATIFMEWLTWIYLALTAFRKEEEYAYDVRTIGLSIV